MNSVTNEGQILARLERAEDEISRGDETAARDSLSAALSMVQQSRTGSLERTTSQAVLDCVSLMWAMTEVENDDTS